VTAQVSSEGKRLLIGAERDGECAAMMQLLEQEGYVLRLCTDAAELADQLSPSVGAVIVMDSLLPAIGDLPAAGVERHEWSNIPFILITRQQSESRADFLALKAGLPASLTDLVILEQPLGSASLLSTVATVWRSRQRQFEIRDRLIELAEQRATLESLMEHLPVGVCLIDINGATVLSNPIYERYVPNRLIPSADSSRAGRWVAFDDEGRPLPREQFAGARALRGEQVSGLDFRYRSEEGSETWTRISAVTVGTV